MMIQAIIFISEPNISSAVRIVAAFASNARCVEINCGISLASSVPLARFPPKASPISSGIAADAGCLRTDSSATPIPWEPVAYVARCVKKSPVDTLAILCAVTCVPTARVHNAPEARCMLELSPDMESISNLESPFLTLLCASSKPFLHRSPVSFCGCGRAAFPRAPWVGAGFWPACDPLAWRSFLLGRRAHRARHICQCPIGADWEPAFS